MNQNIINGQEIYQFLQKMKYIESLIISFIDDEDNMEENFQNLLTKFIEYRILENSRDLKEVLFIIISIANNFYRKLNFFAKIEKIILFFKDEIQNFWTNTEIFQIFKLNKRILLFLIDKKILELNIEIIKCFFENDLIISNYILFFYPEIKHILKDNFYSDYEQINQSDIDYNIFIEKRKIGENDNLLYQFIRNDSIDEFISYIKCNQIPLTSKIFPSIFETNLFLLHNSPTLIEYAAFFGSIQIFQYLLNNGVKLTPTIWNYLIHGRNLEIMNEVEKNKIKPINDSFINCLAESIKCHDHNSTQFIYGKYIKDSIIDIQIFNKAFNEHCVKCNNFVCLQFDSVGENLNSLMKCVNCDDAEKVKNRNCFNCNYLFFDLLADLFESLESFQANDVDQNEVMAFVNEEIKTIKNYLSLAILYQ